MIKAVIIDDEKDARFMLRNQLERHFSERVKILGEADDVQPGMQLINQEKPNLVFLDVRMQKGTGFDLLSQIENPQFEVVFVTAYNQYAVEAFKFSAFGYLLKPIKASDLDDILTRFEAHSSKQKQEDPRLKVLIENYGDEGKIHKLVVSNVDGFQVVEIKNIIRLEGDGNYTHFIVSDQGRITSSKSLGEYEKMLTEYGFFRVHQSTVVNLRQVRGYKKGDGGFVEMSDGESVNVSRHRKAEFLSRFK